MQGPSKTELNANIDFLIQKHQARYQQIKVIYIFDNTIFYIEPT